MKTNVGKSFVVCLCLLVASSSCFQEHIQTLTSKVIRLFGNDPRDSVSSTTSGWKSNDKPVLQCTNNYSNDRYHLLGVDLRYLGSRIANNWLIIAVSSVLPFIVFWRIQYNMRHRVNVQKTQIVSLHFVLKLFFSSTTGKNHSFKKKRSTPNPDD